MRQTPGYSFCYIWFLLDQYPEPLIIFTFNWVLWLNPTLCNWGRKDNQTWLKLGARDPMQVSHRVAVTQSPKPSSVASLGVHSSETGAWYITQLSNVGCRSINSHLYHKAIYLPQKGTSKMNQLRIVCLPGPQWQHFAILFSWCSVKLCLLTILFYFYGSTDSRFSHSRHLASVDWHGLWLCEWFNPSQWYLFP